MSLAEQVRQALIPVKSGEEPKVKTEIRWEEQITTRGFDHNTELVVVGGTRTLRLDQRGEPRFLIPGFRLGKIAGGDLLPESQEAWRLLARAGVAPKGIASVIVDTQLGRAVFGLTAERRVFTGEGELHNIRLTPIRVIRKQKIGDREIVTEGEESRTLTFGQALTLIGPRQGEVFIREAQMKARGDIRRLGFDLGLTFFNRQERAQLEDGRMAVLREGWTGLQWEFGLTQASGLARLSAPGTVLKGDRFGGNIVIPNTGEEIGILCGRPGKDGSYTFSTFLLEGRATGFELNSLLRLGIGAWYAPQRDKIGGLVNLTSRTRVVDQAVARKLHVRGEGAQPLDLLDIHISSAGPDGKPQMSTGMGFAQAG